MRKRIRDYGIVVGSLPTGKLNKITDVKGVRVGHSTIDTLENKTGVTVLIPREENPFNHKLIASSYVINGFGKTAGLVQLEELGTLESVIALTNTLNLGKIHEAVVDYTVERCRREGVELSSFNPLVAECNDSYLNNIQNRVVEKDDFYQALETACEDFEEGDVGAGKGMSCHEFKGGIGSSSRLVKIDNKTYTIGAMVLSNYGDMGDLNLAGRNIGKDLAEKIRPESYKVEGSIVIILATDLPLTSRQVKRLCKRAVVGISRMGSQIGNGSGDIVIGFTRANSYKEDENISLIDMKFLKDDKLSESFRAVAEAVEESVLNSLITSNRVVGYRGNTREALKDYIEDYI